MGTQAGTSSVDELPRLKLDNAVANAVIGQHVHPRLRHGVTTGEVTIRHSVDASLDDTGRAAWQLAVSEPNEASDTESVLSTYQGQYPYFTVFSAVGNIVIPVRENDILSVVLQHIPGAEDGRRLTGHRDGIGKVALPLQIQTIVNGFFFAHPWHDDQSRAKLITLLVITVVVTFQGHNTDLLLHDQKVFETANTNFKITDRTDLTFGPFKALQDFEVCGNAGVVLSCMSLTSVYGW
jgi:hypothetical protein